MPKELSTEVRAVVESTAIGHLATVLPDGSPHSVPIWVDTEGSYVVFLTGPESRKARNLRQDPRVALSLTAPDNPFLPVTLRGRVVDWLDGDAAWTIVDRVAMKYIGQPYDRNLERVVALIEVDHHTVGVR
ncbi:PPOX class F420-dependent oxidoreductase [Kribbella italica]|uniref:PPOX class probable F420-dependent enzyme n=1 Tax=Kribbella italica TaxID=1540520 RepID=A0A7W9MS64_9ACTN|nr:PPOX class F420-dependent oxidoreductase [Kribbella italica]MBB5833583.1 PPOX class probable F420-dependent enzyme [Kribbella italica]